VKIVALRTEYIVIAGYINATGCLNTILLTLKEILHAFLSECRMQLAKYLSEQHVFRTNVSNKSEKHVLYQQVILFSKYNERGKDGRPTNVTLCIHHLQCI
jgi:hypothetical protein